MPVVTASYPTARTRVLAVAELSSVTACKAPARQKSYAVLQKQGSYPGLQRQKSCVALHRQESHTGQQGQKSYAGPGAHRHERTLELLRGVLGRAVYEAAESSEISEPVERWGLRLKEQRAAFAGALRALQHPHGDTIEALNALLCNRVAIGLLDAASAGEHGRRSRGRGVGGGCGAQPIAMAGGGRERAGGSRSLSSSLGSDDSAAETLDGDGDGDADRAGDADRDGLWRTHRRSASVCSDHTAVGSDSCEDALADGMGTCWPLDAASADAARAWGRFYADLGGVRVPTRFRVPRHSLAMLAAEQLMMRNDKIVCPLKNRLHEPNPRRQRFEDHIAATGELPPPPPAALRRSPLRAAQQQKTAAAAAPCNLRDPIH
ncbi:hypothetical protein GGI02_000456 [Coemansia sp. RSA 2322]|nr:hypothetical protein GGI02_000456 [Coemansia sp. RSA 2322]